MAPSTIGMLLPDDHNLLDGGASASFATVSPVREKQRQWATQPKAVLVNHVGLPRRFPSYLHSSLAWTPSHIRQQGHPLYILNELEKEEVKHALMVFKGLGLDGQEVSSSNFPLPSLSKKLHALAHDVHHGTGFGTIRGFEGSELSHEDNLIVYLGVSSYIGQKRGVQDIKGNMLAHIRNAKYSIAPQDERPVRHSNITSYFHTDPYCDIVAMQMRSEAAAGGRHSVASSWSIYNELVATRPDVISTLAEPNWYFDTRERYAYAGGRPLLFHHDDRIIFDLRREPVLGPKNIQRPSHIPLATSKQLEALDIVQSIAERNEVELPMQPGDLTFINNFALIHRRQAFTDSVEHTRYLIRLWLKSEDLAWKLPEQIGYGNQRMFNADENEMHWNVMAKEPVDFTVLDRVDLIS